MLEAIQGGRREATDELIPVVYGELRRLAAAQLARERPGQTLQATALVHEAYLVLRHAVGESWNNRRHFFGAAAEAMRRILIQNARRKGALKRGGAFARAESDPDEIPVEAPIEDILDLDDALEELAARDPRSAELVKLRYFAGLTLKQIAELMGISLRSANRLWSFAKVWLFDRLTEKD